MWIDRTDPEQPRTLQHIWRKLHCLNYCQFAGTYRSEWQEDVGYCLDRYSLIDSMEGRHD